MRLLVCASRYKIPRTKSGVRFVHGDAREVDMTAADIIWLNDAVRQHATLLILECHFTTHVNGSLHRE